MTTKESIGFLFGRADAIRTVASSSSAIWTGIVLVLLTAFARNYDQTYILEKPFLWFFGPLLFSLMSGTWLFIICYGLCARRLMKDADGKMPEARPAWRGFMGAFWITAPIAWLYAIPVERFFDSLTAAKANIALLTVVSLWRVLLMARVFQVVTAIPYARTLLWVAAAAAAGEVIGFYFASGAVMKKVMASMSGLRNSPEEELLLAAMGRAGDFAMMGFVVAVVVLIAWRYRGTSHAWPRITPAKSPLIGLTVCALFWIIITVPNQKTLRLNNELEMLMANEQWRAAVEFMNATAPDKFAPARQLPPKLYEFNSVRMGFQFAGAVTADDAPWVRQHVVYSLDVVTHHLAAYWKRNTPLSDIHSSHFHFDRFGFRPDYFSRLLEATNRPSELTHWLKGNANLLSALRAAAEEAPIYSGGDETESEKRSKWRQLAVALDAIGVTNTTLPEPPDIP